jgi:membrane-bound inhibitor of C-type lysozyme
MKAVIAAFVASIGCACTPMMTRDDSSNDREVAFSCANGESLSVRFLPAQGVAVLVRNGKTMELQQQSSGSGFIYSNGPNTIRGKGNDLTVEIGRMVPIQCKAR